MNTGVSGLDNIVVVRVDGGICSQIEFVELGLYLNRRFNMRMKYGLSRFGKVRKDINCLLI